MLTFHRLAGLVNAEQLHRRFPEHGVIIDSLLDSLKAKTGKALIGASAPDLRQDTIVAGGEDWASDSGNDSSSNDDSGVYSDAVRISSDAEDDTLMESAADAVRAADGQSLHYDQAVGDILASAGATAGVADEVELKRASGTESTGDSVDAEESSVDVATTASTEGVSADAASRGDESEGAAANMYPDIPASLFVNLPPNLQEDPTTWATEDVCEWARALGFGGQAVRGLRKCEITGEDLLMLLSVSWLPCCREYPCLHASDDRKSVKQNSFLPKKSGSRARTIGTRFCCGSNSFSALTQLTWVTAEETRTSQTASLKAAAWEISVLIWIVQVDSCLQLVALVEVAALHTAGTAASLRML